MRKVLFLLVPAEMAVRVEVPRMAVRAVLETRQVYLHHRAAMAAPGLRREVAAAAAVVGLLLLAQMEHRQ